jgi:uncharacterized repeat protein (TIGR01451 family)
MLVIQGVSCYSICSIICSIKSQTHPFMLTTVIKIKSALVCLLMLMCQGAWAATCFAFDDTSGSLLVFDQSTPLTIRKSVVIPTFGGEQVESAYFDGVNNRYYIVRQTSPNTLGFVDPLTDTYIQVSPASGMGTTTLPTVTSVGNSNGAGRITGLTRNPVTNKWYVMRLEGFLFEINPSTGVFVPGAFGGNDYLQLRTAAGAAITAAEDLVFDNAGQLFVSTGTVLYQNISLATGFANAQVATTGFIEGITMDQSGVIRVVMGANTAATSRNVYTLNTATGATTLLFNLPNIGGAADYESIGCNPLPERSDLQLSKSVSPSSVITGRTTTFTLGLFNGGVDPAFQVNVQDAIPAGLTFVSSNIQGTCTACSFNGATGLWSIDQILLGQRITLTFVVSTTGVTPNTSLVNRAQVTQSCNSASTPCVALPDPDSTPNNKTGTYSATEDDEATANLLVTPSPSVGKAIDPSSGPAGSTATLVLTLSNPSTSTVAVLSTALVDTYPAGMVNASAPNPLTNCGGAGAIVAAAGGNSVTVPAGRSIAVGSSCTVTVVIQLLNQGVYDNGIPAGALVTNVGNNFLPVTATYVAAAQNTSVVKNFVPNAIGPGQTATLRLTLSNPANVTATLLAPLVDTYPLGLVNAPTPNPQTSCPGSGAIVAAASGSSLTVPATRSIAPNSSCTVTVVVTSASIGAYTNTIAAAGLSTTVGFNFSGSNDTLLVDGPRVEKSFTPATIQSNGISQLRIVFINPLPVAANLSALFTDVYPAGVVNATPSAVADTCATGVAAATDGANSVTMSAGTIIPALGQCQLTVNVTGTANGVFVNSIPAGSLSTSLGVNSAAVSATLTIATPVDLRVTKTPNIASTSPTGTVIFTVSVFNAGPNTATLVPFTDELTGLSISGAVTRTAAGGATVTGFVSSATAITATLTLPPTSTVNFIVAALPTIFSGSVTNTAIVGTSTTYTDTDPANNAATATVRINQVASLSVTKTDGITTTLAGQSVSYTLTFANAGPSPADGALVKDTPSSGLTCTSLVCTPTAGASCGAITVGTLTSPAGHALPTFAAGSTVTVVLTCQVTATGL